MHVIFDSVWGHLGVTCIVLGTLLVFSAIRIGFLIVQQSGHSQVLHASFCSNAFVFDALFATCVCYMATVWCYTHNFRLSFVRWMLHELVFWAL